MKNPTENFGVAQASRLLNHASRGILCLAILLAFFCPNNSSAATTNLITAKVTVITAASNNFTFTLNGDTRVVTNVISVPGSQIITNHTVAGAASNLFYHASSYGFSGPIKVTGYTNGSNVLYFRGTIGGAMAVSGLSNWFTVAYSTQTVTSGSIDLRVPVGVADPASETNAWSLALTALDTYPTNTFRTNSPPLANYLSLGPQSQTASNKDFNASTLRNSTVTNSPLTNIPYGNVNSLTATQLTGLGGSVSNVAITNSPWINGINGGLTNGPIVNATNVNSPGGTFTNVVVTKKFQATNAIIDGLTATNLNAPGSGANSQVLGASATASGSSSIALGVSATATATGSAALGNSATSFGLLSLAVGVNATADTLSTNAVAIGNDAYVNALSAVAIGDAARSEYINSVALGAGSAATADNQIRLGRSISTVSVPGVLSVEGSITNVALTGTNRFDGGIYITETNATGMANGDVLLNFSPNVTDVELSGNTATINICGIKNGARGRDLWIVKTNVYNLVIKNLSGAAGTAASERIFTGTGGDITYTNRELMVHLRYRGNLSAWVLDKPN